MTTTQEAALLGLQPVAVLKDDTADAVATATGSADDEANEPTIIGLLKQIIVKLGDVETAVGS